MDSSNEIPSMKFIHGFFQKSFRWWFFPKICYEFLKSSFKYSFKNSNGHNFRNLKYLQEIFLGFHSKLQDSSNNTCRSFSRDWVYSKQIIKKEFTLLEYVLQLVRSGIAFGFIMRRSSAFKPRLCFWLSRSTRIIACAVFRAHWKPNKNFKTWNGFLPTTSYNFPRSIHSRSCAFNQSADSWFLQSRKRYSDLNPI